MSTLAKNAMLAQRLLGIGHALKSAGQGPADGAAAMYPSLISSFQLIHLSTEAGGDGASATDPEAPRKRRGRPPKAKPAETETETISTSTASSSSSAKAAKPSPSSAPKAAAATPKTELDTPPPCQPRRSKPKLPRLPQGLSTIINPLIPKDPTNWHSGASVADLAGSSSGTTTTPPPFGFYIDVPATALPEAEATFYYDPLLTEEKIKQTHYGCKGATAEFAFSRKKVIMHRPVIATVIDNALALQGSSSNRKKIYVDGWTGAGKSMALYTLAATARAAGKVVMYIPAASLLTQGGRFYRRGEDEEEIEGDENSAASTVWDTPEAARHILTAVMNAHADQLTAMSSATLKKTLAEVATVGLASTDPTEIVEAAIAVKDGILADYNGMVIVDEYNALYSHTSYHEPMHQFYRRPLQVEELSLAKAFRLLEDEEEYKGVAVVAPTYGGSISPALHVLHQSSNDKSKAATTRRAGIDVIRVPRYDVNEVSSFAAMSVSTGGLVSMPSEVELRRALALTNGNGKELREMQSTLLLSEGPLGPSLGYKAFAVAKKQYNVALEM